MEYDFLIVGGGSAGSVLAHRLSSRSGNRVLLCEAGRDLTEGAIPDDIRESYPGTAYINMDYLWRDLRVGAVAPAGNRDPAGGDVRRIYQQARILGGGSSINGQLGNWGLPSDYDAWEAGGARGWNWESVLPFFRKVERDLDFREGHGRDGKIAVRRIFPPAWNRHAKAAGQAFAGLGYPYIEDQNADFRDGYFPLAHTNMREERVSAATTYLDRETRRRANLTIRTGTHVTGLLFDGRRCIGARLGGEGQEEEVRAREVILSAGALHTPAILQRSGIGSGAHLLEIGVPVIEHLPGVGQNLMDHPQVSIASFIKPGARNDQSKTGRHVLVGLRYSSGLAGTPPGDMFAICIDRTAWHAVGRQIGALSIWVNKTYSRDGEVRIVSKDWRDEPRIDFNLLSDQRDMERLKHGLRMLGTLHMTRAMQEVSEHPFPACYTERARQVGVVNRRNRLLTGMMAALLDGPAPLRRALMKRYVWPAHGFDEVMRDDRAMEAFIRESVAGVFHASCTCRMGDAGDPMAVTNAEGRVRGVGGLRVADASLFPAVPCANTNLPTFMVAEKIADAILGGGGSS